LRAEAAVKKREDAYLALRNRLRSGSWVVVIVLFLIDGVFYKCSDFWGYNGFHRHKKQQTANIFFIQAFTTIIYYLSLSRHISANYFFTNYFVRRKFLIFSTLAPKKGELYKLYFLHVLSK
jgi:hypothetical protein